MRSFPSPVLRTRTSVSVLCAADEPHMWYTTPTRHTPRKAEPCGKLRRQREPTSVCLAMSVGKLHANGQLDALRELNTTAHLLLLAVAPEREPTSAKALRACVHLCVCVLRSSLSNLNDFWGVGSPAEQHARCLAVDHRPVIVGAVAIFGAHGKIFFLASQKTFCPTINSFDCDY